MPQLQKNIEADIAVLQTEYKNLDAKFDDIKHDVKMLDEKVDIHAQNTYKLIHDFKQENKQQHAFVEEKIHALEKWRWMVMGAGMAFGALGYSSLQAFLL
jgi:hypothetical protein